MTSTTAAMTPLIEIEGIFAKLECVNPTGSVKDRIARYIIDESERQGRLRPGMHIVEATSGNTGIALAAYGREKGYEVTIVMPENMTEERKELIRSFGANLVLCSEEGSFAEAVQIRDEMAKQPGMFNPDQFSSKLNVECHYKTTGHEILEQLEAAPDCFVAGIGTGGTLIGVGRAIRNVNPAARIVAVEPTEAAVMSGGAAAPHGIYGIGDGFIPPIASDADGLHPMIDDVICVGTEEARLAALELAERYSICVGVSSGANFLAAKMLAQEFGTVVTIFADGYGKYSAQGLRKVQCPFEDRCPSMRAEVAGTARA